MSKIDLKGYTSSDIVDAVLELPADTFIEFLNALGVITLNMQRRGNIIGQNKSKENFKHFLDRSGETEQDKPINGDDMNGVS